MPVLVFVVLALVTGGLVLARRAAAWPAVIGLAVWTVGYWIVRMVLIATNGHEVGFVVVHAVLAVVASTLAVLAGRGALADRAAAGSPPGADTSRPAAAPVR